MSLESILHPTSNTLKFPIIISFLMGFPFSSFLNLLIILTFSSIMLFSPIIISPPSAIILQAGCTIQFSPNEKWPYNSVFEQIVIPE